MRPRNSLAFAAILLLTCIAGRLAAQAQPPPRLPLRRSELRAQAPPQGPGQGGRGRGQATFPAQQRPPGDPAVIARGKTLFGINAGCATAPTCAAATWAASTCFARSSCSPISTASSFCRSCKGGRQNPGMPPMPPFPQIPDDDVKAIAEYIHSVACDDAGPGQSAARRRAGRAQHRRRRRRGRQGVLRGEVQRRATRRPATCRASRRAIADPMQLQNAWVAGGGGGRRTADAARRRGAARTGAR